MLDDDRRAHSVAAGARAESALHVLPPALRGDVVAATLHDIGYGHEEVGFHPLDGAAYLKRLGFSATICHLVAHHSGSTYEAELRGISLDAYRPYDIDRDDLGPAHAVVWWADLTTGPQGQVRSG